MPVLEYDKQERFCQEYVFDLIGCAAILRTHCYERTEWTGEKYDFVAELDPTNRDDRNYAGRIARRILRYPDVRERIDELLKEKKLQTKINQDENNQHLLQMAQHECIDEPTQKEKLAAIKELNKINGAYAEDNKQQQTILRIGRK